MVSLQHGDIASIQRTLTVVLLHVCENVDLYLPGLREHIHPPRPGAEITASNIHTAKMVAQENSFKSAGAIVNELRENVPIN